MKKPLLTLLLTMPIVLACLTTAHAADAGEPAQQKFSGKTLANPDRPDASADSPAVAALTTHRATLADDFSLYRIWFDFTHDSDGDGYFNQFNVNLDIDTRFSSASIYVTGQLDNGASTPLFRTAPFTIGGATGNDSYQATVLLTEGYPAGRYGLTLRVYDARTNTLLLNYGPHNDSSLGELYLEDVTRESAASVGLHLFRLDFSLSGDRDRDGYYTTADIRFDADAPDQTLTLYGKLYLIDLHGDWIPLQDIGTFSVSGYAQHDQQESGFTLETGFQPQRYRLGLELYSAYSHTLLLTATTPDAAPAHMESRDYDNYQDAGDSHGERGGGAYGGWMLAGLLALLIRRRIR